MSYLARLREKLAENRYSGALTKPTEPSFVSFDCELGKQSKHTLTIEGLPATVLRGLEKLRASRAPDIARPALWSEVVSDAIRLVDEGWAQRALALGWSPLDLFGAVADPEADPAHDGLAVKLTGRRVLAVCESFATIADMNGGRSYLHRGDTTGVRWVWDLGRG